jgi:hypothetical protein
MAWQRTMTTDEINQWIDRAKPGDTLVYHHGDLSAEARPDKALAVARNTLWIAMKTNRVRLIQRRRPDVRYRTGAAYDYIAVRRDPADERPMPPEFTHTLKVKRRVPPPIPPSVRQSSP